MMYSAFTLLAASGVRSTFEWGRIQSESDWLLPIGVLCAMIAFVVFMYRRDSVELSTPLSVLLTALRVAALLVLFVVYLQPQWRNEVERVTNSRVLIMADTSLSMGLHDSEGSPVPAEPSRAQKVIVALKESPFIEQLRATHDVVLSRFDQDVYGVATLAKRTNENRDDQEREEQVTIEWDEAFAPHGSETRLGQALRKQLHEERSQPVAGLIVITDGQQNAGIDAGAAVAIAREANIPLFPIGIGSDRQPVNVRVSDFIAPARAYPGDKYKVTGYIQAQGLAGQTVNVELSSAESGTSGAAAREGGRLEATEPVTLGADGEVVPVTFELVPEVVGRRTLRLRVSPPARDAYAGDDQQEVDIEIVDRKSRVLLFGGGATREYQFLRNLLLRDKEVQVDLLLQDGTEDLSKSANKILDEFPATREELYDYDCIVAFDVNWAALDAKQIDSLDRWVSEQAGGLVVVAGPIYTDALAQDAALSKIRALYPVEFSKRLTTFDDARYGSKEPWPVEFTRDGADAEFLWIADTGPSSGDAWAEFRGVFGYFAVKGPKPGATVYATFSDPRAKEGNQQPPYFVGQFFGAGRVFYLGSGEMWRMRADDEGYFERFYTKLIRFVSQGRLLRGSNRGVLLVERDRYFLGNTVAIRAKLTDARLDPLTADQVALQVYLPDSTQQTVTLLADRSQPGNFAGQFAVRKEGVYRLELPVPDTADDRLTRRIQVKVPDLEREKTERNDALLGELAAKTGGVYFVGLAAALDDSEAAAPLISRLSDRSRTTIQLVAPERLWDNWLMLSLVVGLLSTEWLIRRLVRLA